jgi:hypothetical protein
VDIRVSLHSILLTSLEFKIFFLEVFGQLSSKVFYVKAQLGPHAFYGMGLTFLNAPLSPNHLDPYSFDIVSSSLKLCIQF